MLILTMVSYTRHSQAAKSESQPINRTKRWPAESGKNSQTALLVGIRYSKMFKSFYNLIERCCVTRFATQKWYLSRHFSQSQQIYGQEHLKLSSPTCQDCANQKYSDCPLTVANMEKFQPMDWVGIKIATTVESNMEQISLKTEKQDSCEPPDHLSPLT